MRRTVLRSFLDEAGYEKYEKSRQALQKYVFKALEKPGAVISWEVARTSLDLYMIENAQVRARYSQQYHHLIRGLLKVQRVVPSYHNNEKTFIVVAPVPEKEGEGMTADYESIFPKLKKHLWKYLIELKAGQEFELDDLFLSMELPPGTTHETRLKCRNYLAGRLLNLTTAGKLRVPETRYHYTRKKRYTRTEVPLDPPKLFTRYFRLGEDPGSKDNS